ncbi:probable tRNA (uracil-O(2)-)-methyltransferase isoform X4 [Pezoporus wallicus]|uniref:probable tRNA (uracil-O(2)-)-methyltransferase isoform X4 n=1 Tax=Pezoporus wallicus TaxID=35540 RepID=UPI002550142E|nr:probable tRNA (uracil-O(2)-)-methyltransferase isoform X4 [Pezoporus wallicus]XP_061324211.1 probable tRNA (uracil-O(2)-)-methyltransferase isoform X4 [Pezoporus flaviventris]
MGLVRAVGVRDGGAALPHGFWAAVRVWLEKPQVANRRLCGAAIEVEGTVALGKGGEESSSFAAVWGSEEQGERVASAGAAELGRLWREVCAQLSPEHGHLPPPLTPWAWPDPRAELRAVLRTLLPRARPAGPPAPPMKELAVQDVYNGTVTFLPLEENSEGKYKIKKCNIYQIQLVYIKDEEWSVSIVAPFPEDWFSDGIAYPKLAWLENELLSKLAKWSVEQKPSEFKSTLSLISVAKYSKVYQDLKEKYKEMVKVWPEVTDPEKFVYEDVAIATYLLESTIMPGDTHLFPDTDWLIGNHSDELTPWIPVIAARSSYSCRYFVLPCCFFDFYGKYSRRQSKKTQYREYLDFVAQVGFVCGFNVEEDCLRIPSTKRVSLIGKSRTYPPAEHALIDKQITQYINNHQTCALLMCNRKVACNHKDHSDVCKEASSELPENETKTAGTIWMPGFQPREKVEQIRNCASLPRDFVDDVVLSVANLLLNATSQNSCSDMRDRNTNTWNQGESLSLKEVAEHLHKETLKRLKSEYGGLQTLLKNNHQVFEVLNGRVHIRDWRKEKPSRKTKPEVKRRLSAEAFKTRLCWFFIHHPDGCSLPSESCPYAHGTEELRQSQKIKKKKNIQ